MHVVLFFHRSTTGGMAPPTAKKKTIASSHRDVNNAGFETFIKTGWRGWGCIQQVCWTSRIHTECLFTRKLKRVPVRVAIDIELTYECLKQL